jgi:hypothetical protein
LTLPVGARRSVRHEGTVAALTGELPFARQLPVGQPVGTPVAAPPGLYPRRSSLSVSPRYPQLRSGGTSLHQAGICHFLRRDLPGPLADVLGQRRRRARLVVRRVVRLDVRRIRLRTGGIASFSLLCGSVL